MRGSSNVLMWFVYPSRVMKNAEYLAQVVSALPQFLMGGSPCSRKNLVVSLIEGLTAPLRRASYAQVVVRAAEVS